MLNLQGDVEKIIDANGVVQAIYSYDPWGKILSITSGTGATVTDTHIAKLNGLRYRGYHGDNETQWYYLQSRYYDPFTHRFVNADSYTSTGTGFIGYNMFAYCNNNPVSREDHSGQSWTDFWNFVKEAVEQIGNTIEAFAPAYAACGGLAAADGPLPIGDAIALVGTVAITIGALGYGVYRAVDSNQREKNLCKVAELEKTSDSVAIYYGCRIFDNEFIIETSEMTYFEAYSWSKDHQRRISYGKNTSWGVYTYKMEDAMALATALGSNIEPIYDYAGKGSGCYSHFHVAGRNFLGYYKHFHVWFGQVG